jgi:hypothetical protein
MEEVLTEEIPTEGILTEEIAFTLFENFWQHFGLF